VIGERTGTARRAADPIVYRAWLAGFLLSLGLALLALVDFRRGFLFAAYPVRSLFYAFSPLQIAMVAAAAAGMFACYRAARALEVNRDVAASPSRALTAFALAVFALLVVDLFTYRGVPAARSIASGRINVDWLNGFGVTAWWRPIAQATAYLLNVWHATLIGILMSGLALTVLPAFWQPYVAQSGFRGSLVGALFALPQPFCSCCSSVMAPTFVRRGASTNFLLSFVVGAPMLNITTIILAVALLPPRFAGLRIVAGVGVTVLVTYLVSSLTDRRSTGAPAMVTSPSAPAWTRRLGDRYARLLDLDRIARARPVVTPSQLMAAWLYASTRIALVLVPTLWIWSVVASALFHAVPSVFANNLSGVAIAAIGGTLFMISTWSEIPMALQLIHAGSTGPAAALLVVLPAISLPCMMLLGGALQRFRLVAWLAAAVMAVGMAAGVIFL
jgi:uncharacterized membrane protein YraQ (UPF0718 family)